jgi:hypothetical protein
MTRRWQEPEERKRKRKAPNMSEKLASALLHIRRGVEGGDWLIKGELRKASAREIVSSVDWDHVRRWAEGGENIPQNLQPLPRAEHREKSRKDTTEVAKGKRYGKKEAEHRERLARRASSQAVYDAIHEDIMNRPKRRSTIRSRGFPTKEERRALKERYART